jgi:hypothetical protein
MLEENKEKRQQAVGAVVSAAASCDRAVQRRDDRPAYNSGSECNENRTTTSYV